MVAIPVRLKRVAAAFNEAVARVRLPESSGSEHSMAKSTIDLSNLVESFMEREGRIQDYYESNVYSEVETSDENESLSESETKDILKEMFGLGSYKDEEKEKIRVEVENGWKKIGDKSSEEFNRQLMAYLRERGFDAGVCKSKWEKNAKYPAGEYQYVDVYIDQTRYIVEVSLGTQFQIARPSAQYALLLELFPPVFVGRTEELKRVVRIMCAAIKQSMKSRDLLIPPWRRDGYMQTKWFGPYKRTINTVPVRKTVWSDPDSKTNQAVGFIGLPEISFDHREDFSKNNELRIGLLTAVFGGTGGRMQA